MGMGVALSLLERQFEVIGFDINDNAMKNLESAGGVAKSSITAAVEGCSAVIVLVVNDKQVEEVLFGKGNGSLIICKHLLYWLNMMKIILHPR